MTSASIAAEIARVQRDTANKLKRMENQLQAARVERNMEDHRDPSPREQQMVERVKHVHQVLCNAREPLPPAVGENANQYHLRTLKALWEKVPLTRLEFAPDEAGLQKLERQILASAETAMKNLPMPTEIKRGDGAGRVISEFFGSSPKSWLKQFEAPAMRMTHIAGSAVEDVL